MLPSEAFACHPEIIGPILCIFIGAIALTPVIQSLAACFLKLVPARKFHMFGSVAAETVDAEIFHPTGEPVDNIVGGGTLASLAPRFKVGQTVSIVITPLLGIPFFLQERRNLHSGCLFSDNVGQTGQRHCAVVVACSCESG